MTSSRTLRYLAAPVAVLASLVGVAACSDDASSPGSASGDGLALTGAWARTSPMMVTAGAAYVQIRSDRDDRLIAASVDGAVAGSVEIHEVVPADADAMTGSDMDHGDMGSGMDHGDMGSGDMGSESAGAPMAMVMRELEGGLELRAGETVSLQPGGYHLMMIDLVEPLAGGSTFEIELRFESAGVRTVTFEVRDTPPATD